MKNSSLCPRADTHTQFMPQQTHHHRSPILPPAPTFHSSLISCASRSTCAIMPWSIPEQWFPEGKCSSRQTDRASADLWTMWQAQELQWAGLQLSEGVTNCKALTQGTRTSVQLMWASKLKVNARISEQAFGKHQISMLMTVSPKSTYKHNSLKKLGNA